MLLVAAAEAPLGAAEVGRVRVAFRRIGRSRNEEVVAAAPVHPNAAELFLTPRNMDPDKDFRDQVSKNKA